jgi:hypothetical protein
MTEATREYLRAVKQKDGVTVLWKYTGRADNGLPVNKMYRKVVSDTLIIVSDCKETAE